MKHEVPSSQDGWVDAMQGTESRDVFVSNDIFRRELDQIFNRHWTYLAHETEIPVIGNYVPRSLGDAPVIVLCGAENSLYALLNSCRHRGAKLWRADSGAIRKSICPYHGCNYERDGRLITATFDSLLPENMDFAQCGRIRVPKVESCKGLIFGCWDRNVASLTDYLGDFRWYLDAFVAWHEAYRSTSPMAGQSELETERSKFYWRWPAYHDHSQGVPVIYPTGFCPNDNWDAGSWRRKNSLCAEDRTVVFNDGRDGNEIVSAIAPAPKDIMIYEQKPSGFFGTNLASYLTLPACDSVVVVGTTTSGCVRGTVIDAFGLNYWVAVAEEGCFDRREASYATNLCDMNAKYADFVPTSDVLAFFDTVPAGLFKLPNGSEARVPSLTPGMAAPYAYEGTDGSL
jgi:nicotinamidase-related amidase/nitrite reductase/ring-hydroxylating ferredoxin subunit